MAKVAGLLIPGVDTKAFGEDEAVRIADENRRAQRNRQHPSDQAPDLLAGLRDGTWLDQQVFPPLTYAVPGVIPEGSVLLVGPPKIGKSWFVLTVALATASGGRALGIKVEQRPVLYLALEDGDRRLQDRYRKLLRDQPIPAGFQYLTRVVPTRPIADTIAAWLERQHDAPPLVILDTLGKVMPPAGPGESAYQRDYKIGSMLKQLADERDGMTLLTNHHDRKANSEDFIDSVSGTHGLAGAADTIIVLTRARNEEAGAAQGHRPGGTRGRVRGLLRGRLSLAARRRRPHRGGAAGARHAGNRRPGRSLRRGHQVRRPARAGRHPRPGRRGARDGPEGGERLPHPRSPGWTAPQARPGLYAPVVTVESVESEDGSRPDSTFLTLSTPL